MSGRVRVLLDFSFFEFHMLARNRVIFLHDHFFRHCAGILLSHIEVAGAFSAKELNLLCGWLSHGSITFKKSEYLWGPVSV